MNRNKSLDFERKHEDDLQRLRGFRLLDDDFMSKVFEDKKCCILYTSPSPRDTEISRMPSYA